MLSSLTTHHDRCEEHPENVVEEEPGQEDDSGLNSAKRQVLNALYGECKTQDVVGQPVFAVLVPTAEGQAEQPAEDLWNRCGQVCRLLQQQG